MHLTMYAAIEGEMSRNLLSYSIPKSDRSDSNHPPEQSKWSVVWTNSNVWFVHWISTVIQNLWMRLSSRILRKWWHFEASSVEGKCSRLIRPVTIHAKNFWNDSSRCYGNTSIKKLNKYSNITDCVLPFIFQRVFFQLSSIRNFQTFKQTSVCYQKRCQSNEN